MTDTIVKIQRPLSNNGPELFLVYNEDYSIWTQTTGLRKMFKKDEYKVYHHAKIIDGPVNSFEIGERAPDQSW